MSIALETVVPLLLGLWLDRKLGTVLVFLVLGGALGMGLGLWHLVRLTKALRAGSSPGRNRPASRSHDDHQEGVR